MKSPWLCESMIPKFDEACRRRNSNRTEIFGRQRGFVVGSGLLVFAPSGLLADLASGGGAGAPFGNSTSGISEPP
jgi:hypothetical protein